MGTGKRERGHISSSAMFSRTVRLNYHAVSLLLAMAAVAALSVWAMSLTVVAFAEGRGEYRWPHFHPDDPIEVDRDDIAIPEPSEVETSQYYDFIENTFFGVGRDRNPGALNVNTLGEVPNSSWFTNRIGVGGMTVREIVRGAKSGEGPNRTGHWTIIGAKTEGISPGFTIVDARDDVYFIKFDPADFPEMATSSEAICTPLFHAMGYNVPENYLVDVKLDEIVIGDNTTVEDRYGRKRKMTAEDLHGILGKAPVRADGSLRVMASKLIPNKKVLGHFRYYGTRPDDANDVIQHQLRRELRGLRIFAAWLNHDDARSVNTLDVYTGDEYIRHYLIDFGSCLGSGSVRPQTRRAGKEHMWEAGPTLRTVASLGLWVRPYLKVKYPDYPGVGRFESKDFEPSEWKPEYPNPAFDLMDELDAYWAAKIVMRFSDEAIRAIVESGGPSDPAAREYMIETLVERRDKIGAFYLNRVSPVDGFIVDGDVLRFKNVAVEHGFASQPRGYLISWSAYDNDARRAVGTPEEQKIAAPDLSESGDVLGLAATVPASLRESSYILAEIMPTRDAPPNWQKPVLVFLKRVNGGWEVVGVYR